MAVAVPLLTVPEVTADPIWVTPLNTPKVTVPSFTVPAGEVTVAVEVTFWSELENGACAFEAVVVVGGFTVRVWVLSKLPLKSGPGLYVA